MTSELKILVVYYSVKGATEALARSIGRGIEMTPGCEAVLRAAPAVAAQSGEAMPAVPESGAPYVAKDDLRDCAGLALGSPTRFGAPSAPVQHFLDGLAAEWVSGLLVDKPAAVFSSSNSMHGGQEATLLSLAVPLMHHGMLITGIPYTVPELRKTTSGGSPYGASHVERTSTNGLTQDEKTLAEALGRRLAQLARTLHTP
ncbi:MAG: NAD(P)H:quinone oxidoreductase [Gammaproteobacteria bacterium]|nr:NAD(P)H:quinone oxidoreductase [Gammaproteobacteria bacterium]MDE0414895.1 NAD(P)H:quinone oxidoreductase [Gammaproteobacteria bacterium]